MMVLLRPTALYRRLRNRLRPHLPLEAVIGDVVAHFPVGPVQGVKLPPGGRRSDTVILSTPEGRFALKAYTSRLDAPAITFEHDLLQYLSQTDLPMPRLVTTRDGATWVAVRGRHYACFAFTEGRRSMDYFLLPSVRRRLMERAAETLAHYHALVASYVPGGRKVDGFRPGTHDRWRNKAWYLRQMDSARRAVADHPLGHTLMARWDETRARFEDLWSRIEGPDSIPLPALPIHGDYGPYNILYRDGQLVAVLDFECAHLDWRLTDVLSATVRFAGTRSQQLDLDSARHFLQAYHAVNPLLAEEIAVAPQIFILGRLRNAVKSLKRFKKTHKADHLNSVQKMLQWVDRAETWETLLAEVAQ